MGLEYKFNRWLIGKVVGTGNLPAEENKTPLSQDDVHSDLHADQTSFSDVPKISPPSPEKTISVHKVSQKTKEQAVSKEKDPISRLASFLEKGVNEFKKEVKQKKSKPPSSHGSSEDW